MNMTILAYAVVDSFWSVAFSRAADLDYMQAGTPERLLIEQALSRAIAEHLEPQTLGASSTSRRPARAFGRLCFNDPSAAIGLEASQGILEYCTNFRLMDHGLAKERPASQKWSPEMAPQIEADMLAEVPLSDLLKRRYRRDYFLAEIVQAKRPSLRD